MGIQCAYYTPFLHIQRNFLCSGVRVLYSMPITLLSFRCLSWTAQDNVLTYYVDRLHFYRFRQYSYFGQKMQEKEQKPVFDR